MKPKHFFTIKNFYELKKSRLHPEYQRHSQDENEMLFAKVFNRRRYECNRHYMSRVCLFHIIFFRVMVAAYLVLGLACAERVIIASEYHLRKFLFKKASSVLFGCRFEYEGFR